MAANVFFLKKRMLNSLQNVNNPGGKKKTNRTNDLVGHNACLNFLILCLDKQIQHGQSALYQ